MRSIFSSRKAASSNRAPRFRANAENIKNYHVVFSAGSDKTAVFVRAQQEMISLEYPVEPLLDLANEPAASE